MASKEMKSGVKYVGTIAPQAASGDVDGDAVDTKEFEAVTLVAYGDGTAVGTIKIQESDAAGSGFADAAAGDVYGTQDRALDGSNTVVTLAYIGHKRYVRGVFTHTTNGDVAVVFGLGLPRLEPVSGN